VFRLRVLTGPRRGETFLLPAEPTAPVLIGRGHDVAIRLPDDTTLSRVHAELLLEEGGWTIVNKSQHGTIVGRHKVSGRQRLVPNDGLTLGETEVVFEPVPGQTPVAEDPLTPATPTIAQAPAGAGFDTQGVFHMGHTLMGVDPEIEGSFVWFGTPDKTAGFKVKTRRLYFFLVVAILGLAGCLSTAMFIILPALVDHGPILLKATAFGLVPVLPYLLFIKLLDRNDQVPWSNVLACLAWGGTVGCGFSLVLNAIGGSAAAGMFSKGAAFPVTAVVVAPVVEEIVKGLAVLFCFWILHDEFDNALEGIVLGAASGLGFAVVENSIYNIGFLAGHEGEKTLWALGTYRAVVNALVGHPVYTAMTGCGLGLLRETSRRNPRRWLWPVVGLLTAIGLHVLWNGAAMVATNHFPQNTTPVLVVNALVFGGAGALFFLAVYIVGLTRERRVLLTYLAEEVGKGFITTDELASFERLFGRLCYEVGGLLEGGVTIHRQQRALRRAQVDLAFRKWHLAQGDEARGHLVDAYVLAARTRIRDARNQLRTLERTRRHSTDEVARRLSASQGGSALPPTVPPPADTRPPPSA